MSVPGTNLCSLIFRPTYASRDRSVGRAEDCSWKYQLEILRSVVQIRLARTFSFCSHFSWKTSAARPPKMYVQSFNAMGIHLNEWLLSQCKQYWHLTHSFMCLTFPYTLFRAEKPPVADNRSTLHGDVGCFGFTSPYLGLEFIHTIRISLQTKSRSLTYEGLYSENLAIVSTGLVAQRITRLTTDQKIPGSNPGKLVHIFVPFNHLI